MANSVAEGSLVLTLDASKLNTGMRKAAQKAKQDGKTLASNFKEATGEHLKEATGGDMGIVGMAGKAGAIGAAITGAVMLGKSLWEAFGPAKDLRKELEKAAEASQEWRDKIQDSISVNQEWIASLSDIAGTAEGAARITHHFDQIAGSAETLNAKLKTVKQQQEDWDSWGNWESWSAWMVGGHGDRKKALEDEANALKQAADGAKKAAEAREKLKQSMRIQADQSTRQFVQEMQDAVAVLNGADKDMLRIEAMRRKGGFSEDQLNQMRAAVGMKLAAESAKELAETTKQADEFIKELADSTGLYGAVVQKTAEDAKLEEFVKKGADANQIERMRQLIALKKQMNQQYQPLNALVRGTAQEITFQNKNKFEQDRDKKVQAQLDELKRQSNILSDIRTGVFRDKVKPEI